ncbi:hypothetical protein HIM_02836 [Hirsutella minnesotensis 3608]|nr:hypothetical protein HIM_02836 [Hirsutella minnesotensis 3608]
MRLAIAATSLISAAQAAQAALYDTIFPSERPTATKDPWQCTTEKLPQYFDVPKPTGTLASAVQSYNFELIKDCQPTRLNVYGVPACAFPEPSKWCAFTTAAPSTLLPEYSSYASSASSWWAARSSTAVELAEECPREWYKAMVDMPAGAAWLNLTLIFGECYARAHTTNVVSLTSNAPSVTTTPEVTSTASYLTPTSKVNSIASRGGVEISSSVALWMSGLGRVQ